MELNNIWIKSKEELPKGPVRSLLGYCLNTHDHRQWKGIVQVYFNPTTGWHRDEAYNEKSVHVLAWSELPEVPDDKLLFKNDS